MQLDIRVSESVGVHGLQTLRGGKMLKLGGDSQSPKVLVCCESNSHLLIEFALSCTWCCPALSCRLFSVLTLLVKAYLVLSHLVSSRLGLFFVRSIRTLSYLTVFPVFFFLLSSRLFVLSDHAASPPPYDRCASSSFPASPPFSFISPLSGPHSLAYLCVRTFALMIQQCRAWLSGS